MVEGGERVCPVSIRFDCPVIAGSIPGRGEFYRKEIKFILGMARVLLLSSLSERLNLNS